MTVIMKDSRKQLSHERIVEVAARQIRRAGHEGVGVADVMKQAGLTHGGFYAHFASRDALLVEALQRAGEQGTEALLAHIDRQQTGGKSRLHALVTGYLHDSQLNTAEQGCVVAALGSEMPRQQDAVREAARERVQALISLTASCLPAGSTEAPLLAAALVGSLQLARTLGGKAGKTLLAQSRDALLARYESPGRSD